MNETAVESGTDVEVKKLRKRKKKVINAVRELLEFYFSPSNIAKDGFMKHIVDKNPYVDLEIFHKFNKIKSITDETSILSKAVQSSDILELSEDGTKVKRSKPIEFKANEMECTIYIENIPLDSTRDWLKKVFTPYGTIDYISLPLFQRTGKPKGFAFIEYSSPEEAQKAIEAFGGGLASLDGTLNPAELLSIKTYNQIQEDDIPIQESLVTEKLEDAEEKLASPKKRERSEAFSGDDEENKTLLKDAKKVKISEQADVKKKRKRNKKEKNFEVNKVYLRVMSKSEWKSLRNKYLNMQWGNMKKLKSQLRQNRTSYPNRSYSSYEDYGGYNSYTNQETHEHHNIQDDKSESSTLNFTPNVIIKIKLNSPPTDRKDFRKILTNGRSSIAYVDFDTENSAEVIVRFKTAEACQEFLQEKLYPNSFLIEGQEENDYWDKLFSHMKQKRIKKEKKSQNQELMNRGKDKLVNKALEYNYSAPMNNRIVFED